MTARELDQRYEKALLTDRENVFGQIKAPNLFNWFVGMNSMVTGFALILFSRLTENFQTGRFGDWFMPLQAVFFLGGLGLVLSEMGEKSSQIWKVTFRLVVASAFFALALIWWQGGNYDGVFMTAWLALVILLNVAIDFSSLRSYLVFYQGLLLGLTIISGSRGLLLVVIAYVVLSSWSYFRNKRRFSVLIGISFAPLVVLSFIYGNASSWVRSFLVLTTAMFAFLLPFWDELRFRQGKHRQLVIRMFSVVLSLFLVTILLIRVLQNILITNTQLVLSDKVTYGRVFTDATINNTMSAVKSLAENDIFVRALTRNQPDDLTALSRGFFESNRSLLRIVAVDGVGKVSSVYPLTEGLVGSTMIKRPDGVSLTTDDDSVTLSAPVLANTRVVGSLVGFLNIQTLSDGLQEIATPATGEYFVIVGDTGKWIIGPDGLSSEKSGDPLVTILTQKGNVRQGYSSEGVLTLTASQDLTPFGWKLILVQPLFSALAVNQTAYVVILALASLSALIIGLTILVERKSESKNE